MSRKDDLDNHANQMNPTTMRTGKVCDNGLNAR